MSDRPRPATIARLFGSVVIALGLLFAVAFVVGFFWLTTADLCGPEDGLCEGPGLAAYVLITFGVALAGAALRFIAGRAERADRMRELERD